YTPLCRRIVTLSHNRTAFPYTTLFRSRGSSINCVSEQVDGPFKRGCVGIEDGFEIHQRGTAGLNFDLERWQTDLPDRFNYVADRDFFCRVFRVRIKVNIGAVLNRSITLLICLLKASFSTSTRRVLAACRRLFIFGGLKPDTRRSI